MDNRINQQIKEGTSQKREGDEMAGEKGGALTTWPGQRPV
jgi:hypothetical protein